MTGALFCISEDAGWCLVNKSLSQMAASDDCETALKTTFLRRDNVPQWCNKSDAACVPLFNEGCWNSLLGWVDGLPEPIIWEFYEYFVCFPAFTKKRSITILSAPNRLEVAPLCSLTLPTLLKLWHIPKRLTSATRIFSFICWLRQWDQR